MIYNGYINISINNEVQQFHYRYDDEAAVYIFDEDISIGEWTIKNIVKLGGPKISAYKYDFKNYLEFVIIDKNGISRIKTWFYNDYIHPDSELGQYSHENGAIYSVSFFCEEYPAFECSDWSDYDASIKLKEIQAIIEKPDIDNNTKYKRVENIIKQK